MRAWRGVSDLAGALVDVLHQPGCRAGAVFVQEYVRHLGEARCYVVDGRVAKILFTRFEPPDDEGDDAGRFCTFKEVPRSVILEGWCENSPERLQALDTELKNLCATWGTWLLALDAEPQPFYRIDAFVWWDGGWRLTTGEITELGVFLGLARRAARVSLCAVRSCFRDGALEAWGGAAGARDDATPDRSPTPGGGDDEDDARPGWRGAARAAGGGLFISINSGNSFYVHVAAICFNGAIGR